MTRSVRVASGGILLVAAALALAGLSQVPYTADRRDDALVRLAWRVRSQRVEACRRLTAEELAQRPAHMRQETVCEGRRLPYRLRVRLDGEERVNVLLRASGTQDDRPIFVNRELPVTPGRHRLAVSFVREDPTGEAARPDSGAVAPAELRLETTVDLRRREVALVTYDAEERRLELVGYGRGSGRSGKR